MALDAIIFDVDGTLIDSNALHVQAFVKAFASHGYTVLPDRIAVEIGKGGDNLVPDILGLQADEKDGDAIRADQPIEFEKFAKTQGLLAFPQVSELIATVRKRGLIMVIATSSGKKQLGVLEKYSGLDLQGNADVLITADDATTSKPAPDLIAAAVKKSKLSPAQCVMIGDTIYDATAARHAGVISLGVLCGGNPADRLLSAGMRQIYRDPADLLHQFDQAIQIASPGELHLTTGIMQRLMHEALAVAAQGLAAGEVPIGSILARGDGTIVGRGWNQLNQTKNKTAHAEMVAFNDAAGKFPDEAKDLILVSTLEPCVMCTGAAMEAAVDAMIFALRAPADSGSGRVTPPQSPDIQMPRIVGDILADESLALLKKWFAINSEKPQASYVRQLLQFHKAI